MRALAVVALAGAVVLAGCVTTRRNAPEYKTQYVLAKDVAVYECDTFTDAKSVWFGSKGTVLCHEPSMKFVTPSQVFPSGSKARIVRLFNIGAVDAYYRKAEVRITDAAGRESVVYMEWPRDEGYLSAVDKR